MKKLTLAALLIAAAGAASAQNVRSTDDHAWFANASSTKTRAQVVAELAQARANGELDRGNGETTGFQDLSVAKSTKTREQVRQELAEARANGEYDRLNSEDYAFGLPVRQTRTVSTRSGGGAQ